MTNDAKVAKQYAHRAVAITAYINEKHLMGLLSIGTTNNLGDRGWNSFRTSKTYYVEVLCPELARILCVQGLIPMVVDRKSYVEVRQNTSDAHQLRVYALHTRFNAVDSYLFGLSHYESMLRYLRRSTGRRWWSRGYL